MPDTSSKFSIRSFRRELASIDSLPQFALLGIFSGVVTGLVIVSFRLLFEIPLSFLLDQNFDNFESLPRYMLFLLPFTGTIILALFLSFVPLAYRAVGVVHTLERLGRHQGHLPWQNALVQFVGGIIALGTGQSGGREGPAIHLGAAGSSYLGQKLHLPNNSMRILVGCGAAAAISASFDTPLAGVIFSMEVILMEYSIAGFIPVILASVIAALINQSVYGSEDIFNVQLSPIMNTFYNLPFVLLEGVLIGTLAAAFVYLIRYIYSVAPSQLWLKLSIAGFVTGTFALICPAILGVGYDTINQALSGELTIVILITICCLKMLTSATTVALGVPVGLIGPALVIGAAAGGILGTLGAAISPENSASMGFYVLLGMGAMMGAVLQAPLAALLAVVELTNNQDVLLPAMLVIIIANMTASQVFKIKSLFLVQMEILGLEFRQTPLAMTLNRASVASVMSRDFVQVASIITGDEARQLIVDKPTWLLVSNKHGPAFILRNLDLISYFEGPKPERVDLTKIPATRKDVTDILLRATLAEAYEKLNSSGLQALYVNRITAPMLNSVVGLVTKEDIESYYQA